MDTNTYTAIYTISVKINNDHCLNILILNYSLQKLAIQRFMSYKITLFFLAKTVLFNCIRPLTWQ